MRYSGLSLPQVIDLNGFFVFFESFFLKQEVNYGIEAKLLYVRGKFE
jgi:hypothetical protein